MRLGLGSYTFGWAVGVAGHTPPCPLDEHGLLDRAHDLGVDLVQIGDNLPLAQLDDGRLGRLAERAAREGVTLEVGARGLTPDNLAAHIAICHRLGAPLLRFVIDGTENYHPSPEQVTAMLGAALPALRDGPTLALENHDRFPARTLRGIVEAVGSDRVGICLDTANSLGAGEGLGEVAATLAPCTVNLHVKDFAVERLPHGMGFTVTGRPAGAGQMDLPFVLEQLAPYGRCRTAILELWTPPEPTLEATVTKEAEWASASLDFLRLLFP